MDIKAEHPKLQAAIAQFMNKECDSAAGQHIHQTRGDKSVNELLLRKLKQEVVHGRAVDEIDQDRDMFLAIVDTLEYFSAAASAIKQLQYMDAQDEETFAKLAKGTRLAGPFPTKNDIARLELADDILRKVHERLVKKYQSEYPYLRDTNIENELVAAARTVNENPQAFAKVVEDRLFKHLNYEHAMLVLSNVFRRLKEHPDTSEHGRKIEDSFMTIMNKHPEARMQAMGDAMTRHEGIHSAELIRAVSTEYESQDYANAIPQLIQDIAPVIAEVREIRNAKRGVAI